MGLAPIVNTSIPEATQWENKSRKHSTMNCVRFFLAATLVCMEAMADNSPELKGFNMFSSLLADKILKNQIDKLEEKRFLGMQDLLFSFQKNGNRHTVRLLVGSELESKSVFYVL